MKERTLAARASRKQSLAGHRCSPHCHRGRGCSGQRVPDVAAAAERACHPPLSITCPAKYGRFFTERGDLFAISRMENGARISDRSRLSMFVISMPRRHPARRNRKASNPFFSYDGSWLASRPIAVEKISLAGGIRNDL